jgi:EpsI family protein
VSARLLLIATLCALALPGAMLARWLLVAETPIVFADPPELPREIGPWHVDGESSLDDEVLAIITPDQYTMRHYTAPGRTPIWVYLGVYAGRAGYGSGAHDPEVCYPAQGWEILASERFVVPLAADAGLRTKLLEAHLGTAKEVVMYWFQPALRWPGPEAGEELMRVVDAVSGRPQYAFVRLSGPSDGGDEAERDLAEFAALIANPIRDYVESGSVDDAQHDVSTGSDEIERYSP